jgi:hypothetical protein
MKRRAALYAAAVLAVGGIWYALVYLPGTDQRAQLRLEIAEAERQLDDFNRTMKELPGFLKISRSLESLRHDLNSSLYAKSDILELFRQITQDAVTHNLKVLEISPPVEELLQLNRTSGDTLQPQFLNIRLDMSGRYVDFGKYITRLESTPYFRAINRCHIRGDRTPTAELDMTISFRALIGSWEESA